MSIRGCVASAVNQNELSPEQADEILRIYDGFLRQHRLAFGEAEAQRRAQADTAERLAAEATQRKRAALLQAAAAERLDQVVMSHRNARGEIDPAQALWMLIEHHGQTRQGLATGSVEGRRKALIGTAHARLEEMLHEFRRSAVAGRQLNPARLDNVVRELFGEGTGDVAAKGMAKAWSQVAEDLRQRYNEMGGTIGKREDWGLPQRHDASKIRAKGFAAWYRFTAARLDRAKMASPLTGKPMADDELRTALEHIYDGVTTDGWAHRDPSMQRRGKGAIVRQHAESRFLVFKGADAWLDYQRAFGEGNAFASMMGHVNVMARDIAAMQVLGPNPDATLEWLKQKILKEAHAAARGNAAQFPTRSEFLGRQLDAVAYARSQIHFAEQIWANARGAADTPVATGMANTFAAARNWVSAASLGSAIVSAQSDLVFQKVARMFAGVKNRHGNLAVGFDLIGDVLSAVKSGTKRDAVRSGLILDSALHVMGEQARHLGAVNGPEITRYVVDRVLTISGLTAWTRAGKHAFGLSMMSTFADHVATPWNRMPKPLRRTLERYGLSREDWALIAAAPRHDLAPDGGSGAWVLRPLEVLSMTPEEVRRALGEIRSEAQRAELLRALETRVLTPAERDAFVSGAAAPADDPTGFGSVPSDTPDAKLARHIRDVAERYHEMILQETNYAVPEGTLGSRALWVGDNQPGTLRGELFRSAAQFKSFGTAVALLHGARIFREIAHYDRVGGARYAAGMLIGMTLLGGLVLQLRALRDGRDPEDVNRPEFWTRAMVQGGGFGIWGDFLVADTNRFGGGWAPTLAGPLPGRVENVWNLTAGNLRELATDKNTNFGRELTTFVDASTPLSSLWFTKAIWQRTVIDALQDQLDPAASAAHRRRMHYMAKRGSSYWWRPGQSAPARAPDLSSAVGG